MAQTLPLPAPEVMSSRSTDGVLDYETKSSYTVTVRVTDAGGLFYDELLTVRRRSAERDADRYRAQQL